MKTYKIISIIGIFAIIISATISCSSTDGTYKNIDPDSAITLKSGAQLWGENCVRCHSVPAPSSYNSTDWETIGLHMRIRANLTAYETDKIFEFLKSAN